MGLYRLKLRKKFILLPSNSSLDFTWYQRLRLANIGREDFFDLHCRVGGHSRTSLSTFRICLSFALCHCCKQSLKKTKTKTKTNKQTKKKKNIANSSPNRNRAIVIVVVFIKDDDPCMWCLRLTLNLFLTIAASKDFFLLHVLSLILTTGANVHEKQQITTSIPCTIDIVGNQGCQTSKILLWPPRESNLQHHCYDHHYPTSTLVGALTQF